MALLSGQVPIHVTMYTLAVSAQMATWSAFYNPPEELGNADTCLPLPYMDEGRRAIALSGLLAADQWQTNWGFCSGPSQQSKGSDVVAKDTVSSADSIQC